MCRSPFVNYLKYVPPLHKRQPRLAYFRWLITGGLTLLKSMYYIFKVQNLCIQYIPKNGFEIQKKLDEADNKLYNQLMSNHNFTKGCWATCSMMILTKKGVFEGTQFLHISHESWMNFYGKSSTAIAVLEIVMRVKVT